MDEQGREPIEELTLEPPAVVPTRRPPVLWAVLAAVALATGALVVTSSNDDAERRPGLPVALAFGGSGGGEAAADASRLAWVIYEAGDDLPNLGGAGTAYKLAGAGDQARVEALADALGAEGEVRRTETGWSVTGAGGLGRLEVHARGGAYWSWFAGNSDCVSEDGGIVGCYEECTVSSDGVERCSKGASGSSAPPTTTTVVGGGVSAPPAAACAPPEPGEKPADCDDVVTGVTPDTGSGCDGDDCTVTNVAPGEQAPDIDRPEAVDPPDDVARVALDVVEAAGHDVDGAIVNGIASSGEEGTGQWHVTVEPVLGGVRSGLLSFVEVSSDLRALSGSGVLGGAVDLGEYPLLDTRAAIDRANEQAAVALDAVATSDASSSGEAGVATEAGEAGTTGGSGSTDVGGTDDVGPVTTVTGAVDPCAVPEGASDGCGGTTGCGGDGCATDTTMPPCKAQPDGRDICEQQCTDVSNDIAVGAPTMPECTPPPCAPPGAEGPPESRECPPPPNPGPLPEPEPLELTLVDAERSLVLLPAADGSADAYLVPAYRFTAEDGGQVDLPAVADEALTGTPSTEITVPDTIVEPPEPGPVPQPCDVLEEGDASGTTHTVQTCPPPDEDATTLGEGEEPAVGVGYYVDIDKECGGGSFVLGSDTWISTNDAPFSWGDRSERWEGGTFTLDAADHGRFQGDAAATKVGEFRTLQPNEDIFCTPEPRS